jgi:hypothetical protein
MGGNAVCMVKEKELMQSFTNKNDMVEMHIRITKTKHSPELIKL